MLDTETTGLSPDQGHRIVEIGCVELLNLLPTGNELQIYCNPERDIPAEATAVHGITVDMLKDKPIFGDIAKDFLEFIGDSPLVIHNAPFDMAFLNAELHYVGFPKLAMNRVEDTLEMARRMFPGSPASLDALCQRFKIDLSQRQKHGALLDCQLLAEVYLEMKGGRQQGFNLDHIADEETTVEDETRTPRKQREDRHFSLKPEEATMHRAMLEHLVNPLWLEIN